MKIEALHEFHDKAFAQGWADRFVPTEDRLSLFDTIFQLTGIPKKERVKVLELGIGPGYLAEYILERSNTVVYEGVDFSQPMLNIASKRLERFENTLALTQADLTIATWTTHLKTKPDCIISTWALHDLLSKDHILSVYQAVFSVLPNQGLLINGDFIKPEWSTFEYEAGRIKPSEHIALLESVGFKEVACVRLFEENVDQPTTANNYACFRAVKI